jgi:hypothetical protein
LGKGWQQLLGKRMVERRWVGELQQLGGPGLAGPGLAGPGLEEPIQEEEEAQQKLQQQQECLTLAKGNKHVTFKQGWQGRDPRLESWQKQQQEQQQKAKEDLADEGKANP